ncbi:MAG: hypothetical protein PVH88_20395 [Ignavibacteria bacterium]|jgi:hypothetical protein
MLAWFHTSTPLQIEENISDPYGKKAKLYWYNKNPSDTKESEIINEGASGLNKKVLDIVYNPAIKGDYNTSENFSVSDENWGGFILPLELSEKHPIGNTASSLNIWLKIVTSEENTVLNIDIGDISEDVIPNSRLDTEDENLNDILDDGEDLGLDGLKNSDEPGYQENNPDPYSDDFSFSDYYDPIQINGTEGNGDFNVSPDTEDLNKNFYLDKRNNYYTYKLLLNKEYLVTNYEFEIGKNDWIKVKIPLDHFDTVTGTPLLQYSDALRVWMTGTTGKAHIRIAEFKFSSE